MKSHSIIIGFIILSIFLTNHLQADQYSLDSLELKAVTSTGIDKIDLSLNLAEGYLNNQPQKSLDLAKDALELSSRINDLDRKAHSLFLIAEASRAMGNNSVAYDFYFQANKIY